MPPESGNGFTSAARAPAAARRWLATGSSADPDARTAGRDATRQALGGPDPGLLIVYCGAAHDPVALLAGVREVAPEAPLIGCSSKAIITSDRRRQAGVVVMALGGPGFSVATAAATGAATRQREVGARIAGCAAQVDHRPYQVLLLLTDGLASDQEEILAGAYSTVGASVPLVGGVACPATTVRRTFHLHGGEVLTDAAVGAAIGSDAPFGVGLRHGWRKVGAPMIVTRSTNGDVFTLDGQPALPAYLRRLGAPVRAYTDPVAFNDFSRTRPIGVRRRIGEEVRNVSSTDGLDGGWLRSNGEVPEGGVVWPMEGDEDSVVAAAGEACRDAVAALGGRPPLGLLAFDCVARAEMLGTEGMRREVGRMVDQADGVPMAGFYTWGEIARVRGINGFHNQSLVVLAVG